MRMRLSRLRSPTAAPRRPAVCLIHAFDPRGTKMGGLETYVRDFIAFCPPDMRLLVVGVDGQGDLRLGRVATIDVRGRRVEFLPVLAWPESRANGAARRLAHSLTLRFGLGLARHAWTLRRLLRRGGFTIDSRRVELAPIVRLLGVPFVQMMHDEGRKTRRDALIDRYLAVYRWAERLALAGCSRFLCVNPMMGARMRAEHPRHAGKIGIATTWYDPAVLKPAPFPGGDTLRVFYSGRLDVVKDPALMFSAVACLRRRLGGRIAFHYLGGWDPERYPEFAAIRAITTCHGFLTMPEQASLLATLHVGLLTSGMEGMPRAVLESLGAGRPVAAVHLPQLEAVIGPASGVLVPRGDPGETAEALAEAVLGLWARIRSGDVRPEAVAAVVADYTPERCLGLIYAEHRALAQGGVRGEASGGLPAWAAP